MLLSKLDAKKYPTADPKEWLIFIGTSDSNIDPIFAGRLAAFAKANGKKLRISSAYRSTEKQIEIFKKSGGKLVNGEWTGGSGLAAKPGRSWHEFHLAIDTPDLWAKNINKTEATKMQKELVKFGIYKPLTKGNATGIYEDWHIQPIECVGVVNKSSISPTSANVKPIVKESTIEMPAVHIGSGGAAVKELQNLLNKKGYKLVADGSFGPTTENAVKDFQKKNGLTADGKVGPMTWKKLK